MGMFDSFKKKEISENQFRCTKCKKVLNKKYLHSNQTCVDCFSKNYVPAQYVKTGDSTSANSSSKIEKKKAQKVNNAENTMNNTTLENMLSEDDCYSDDKTLKILETLQKSELFQFTDNPVLGEQATYKILTFTQQINNQPMKLVAVFTNHMAMKNIMKEQAFFCVSSVDFFNSISSTVIRDEKLDGIIVNPQQQNYIITKNTLANWKINLVNADLLKLIEEKISSSDIKIRDNYIEILNLLGNVRLPMPIKKDSNGEEFIHINMYKDVDGEIWLCIFTNPNDVINYMKEKAEIRYLPKVLEKFAFDVINNNYSGIVVYLTGKQFVISHNVCNVIISNME